MEVEERSLNVDTALPASSSGKDTVLEPMKDAPSSRREDGRSGKKLAPLRNGGPAVK